MHTVKNNLITDKHQQILYLSPTVEGSLYDKKLADEIELEFPTEGVLMQDLGYIGYAPDRVRIVMPGKRKKMKRSQKMIKALTVLLPVSECALNMLLLGSNV